MKKTVLTVALPLLGIALTAPANADAIADFYLSLGARVVALTLGDEGTMVAAP